MQDAAERDVRLATFRVVRNVEGEIVVTMEWPTSRFVGFLAPDEARELARLLAGALQREERVP